MTHHAKRAARVRRNRPLGARASRPVLSGTSNDATSVLSHSRFDSGAAEPLNHCQQLSVTAH
jgi:hypothetical protein